MNKVDRWLLPDGIEELLPEQALQTEQLRRRLVDQFRRWGYDYVIPPLVEFTDSLLTGSGQDIDLSTFKLTDQLSGRTLGIRADITSQAARMDAHSLKRQGVNRLCYAGHVLHTTPKSPLSSRSPIKVGVEMFGVEGVDAEIEVLSLLIETLIEAEISTQYIDLGHVGIYRVLAKEAQLSDEQEKVFFSLLQSKAYTDIDAWLAENVTDATVNAWLSALPRLSGSQKVLQEAREVFAKAPTSVLSALDDLDALAEAILARYPDAQLYFDLSELRGYHYHTGIVFGAFAQGVGNAIATGGRYDHVGEAFGRSRPATGFDVDLSAIRRLVAAAEVTKNAIFAGASSDQLQWEKVKELRDAGERVIFGAPDQKLPEDYQACDRILVKEADVYEVKFL